MTDILKGTSPVAWRWEGRNRSSGHWERRLTSYKPDETDDQYCRNIVPLYLTPSLARKAASADKLVEAADDLANAERAYRLCHDLKGDGHNETGRAWDYMRRCGDKLRQALAEYNSHD